jgi:hypothetical protein
MARHLAGSGIAQCFLGLAVVAMASQAAMAQTTTLICNADAANVWKDDEPSTIELNETQNIVATHISSETSAIPGYGARLPAHASGPLPATFASDSISFSDQGFNYTLNRLTGSLVRLFNADVALRWTCQAGKKQF